MGELASFGKFLMLAGIITLSLGVYLTISDRIPIIGRLPGDIVIKREGFTFYLPIITSLLISIILTIITNLLFGR